MTGEQSETYVLDATAVLAFVRREPGWDIVVALLDGAAVSAANWSEVLQKALSRGLDAEATAADLLSLGIRVEPVTAVDAAAAAQWWMRASHLSLGDRLCLALAHRLAATPVTSDQAWRRLSGIEALLIH